VALVCRVSRRNATADDTANDPAHGTTDTNATNRPAAGHAYHHTADHTADYDAANRRTAKAAGRCCAANWCAAHAPNNAQPWPETLS
jgi:hypothetical protein